MKKFTRWKSFDFGRETSIDEKPPPPKRQARVPKIKENEKQPIPSHKRTDFDFHKYILPQSVADLAIHPKKIEQIEGWLNFALNAKQNKKYTQFLLLTGPTGSGKSTSLLTVCQAMNVNVTEWINPVDIDYELLRGPGQTTKFLHFFSESKYPSLFDDGTNKKVLLVKEFPNIFIKKPDEFFNVLEECYYAATHPVVFICSDITSGDVDIKRILFPENIQLKYNFADISFNPCAATLLKKALKRAQDILQTNSISYKSPSKDTVEAVVTSSMGDIRTAMNQFFMATLNGAASLQLDLTVNKNQSIKRKRSEKKLTIKSMIKDETLGLFHGLGRVLNPKRRECGTSWRINCDIEKIIEQFSVQPIKFNAFLCENYLKYFGDIHDLCEASDVLSLSTMLMLNWDNPDLLYAALWIEVLGLMIFNRHKESKWTQLTGPKKLEKVCLNSQEFVHPTERFYYNAITKTKKYHSFLRKC